jgi:hypothetical protein
MSVARKLQEVAQDDRISLDAALAKASALQIAIVPIQDRFKVLLLDVPACLQFSFHVLRTL